MKKFLPYILATIIIIGIFGVFGAHRAEAAWSPFGLEDVIGLVFKKAFAWIGYIILQFVSIVLTIAGALLDTSINYSINNFANTSKAIVEQGWMISRDVANLFFIFILLYIAIATILQLSGYGMKELLVTVVVVALLVNFSLVITRFIIDGSNILAMEFYTKATQIQIKGDTTGKFVSPSTAIMASFKPQSLFNSNVVSVCDEYKDPENPTKCTKYSDTTGKVFAESDATLINIGIMTIMGSIMLLVLAFVFFAGAFLFVIRTVMLWLLMIFSPLAFVAMALPATKSYASQWWKKLFDQAFFAPVYLFLLYLVINIVSSKAILAGIDKDNETLSSAIMNPASNVNLILKFVIMIILMLASLVVAKQMGAVGASTMQSWGQSAKKWGQAKAGRISRKGAGWVADKTLDEKNKWGATVGRIAGKIPFATRGLSKVSAMREQEIKKQEKEYQKQYGSYSDVALNAMLRDPIIRKAKTEAINKILTDRTTKKEKEGAGKKREISFEGKKISVKEAKEQILSLKREIITKGDKTEESQKRLTELVLSTAREKKKYENEFGGEEGLTEGKIKEILSGNKPSDKKT